MPIEAVATRIGAIESQIASLPRGYASGGTMGSAVTTAPVAATATTTQGTSLAVGQQSATASSTGFEAALNAARSTEPTTPPQATPAQGDTALGTRIVDAARDWIGVPYKWGGNTTAGVDCSGLVKNVLAEFGISMPRVARQQMHEGRAVGSLKDAQAGDLLVFNNGTHIGIYVGDGKMIDAPYAGRNVTLRDVYEKPTAIRRVIPDASEVANTQGVAMSADQKASVAAQRAALDLAGVNV
ncbi:C40 family peptidase [Jonesia quinghaiensis]|uniref:C40 family peptidase n=1 Tax=Jonesia quinghaiensis TaxID=262806 RepID=UPI0004035DC3|nr:C40 family peptidase [Jonesia quinghaiensis]